MEAENSSESKEQENQLSENLEKLAVQEKPESSASGEGAQSPGLPEKIVVTNEENGEEKTEEFQKPSEKVDFEKECYKCRFCGLSYVYLNTLKAHERVHNVEEPYVCTKCGDSFRFYSELEYHMMGHQGTYSAQCYVLYIH